jgi:hypothetical protein
MKKENNRQTDPLTAILLDPAFHEAVERGEGDAFIAQRLGIPLEEYKSNIGRNGETNSTPYKSYEKEIYSVQSEDPQTISNSALQTSSNSDSEDYWTRVRGGKKEVVPLNFARAHDEDYFLNNKQYGHRLNYKKLMDNPNPRDEKSLYLTQNLTAANKTQNNRISRISPKYPSSAPSAIDHQEPPRRAGLLLTGGMLIGIVAGATGVIFTKDTLTPTNTSNPDSKQLPYTYSYDKDTPFENEKLLGVMSTVVIDLADEVSKKLNPSPTPTSTPEPIPSPTPDLAKKTSFCSTPDPGKLCRIPPPPPPTSTPYPSCEKMNELTPGDWCVWPTPDPRGPYATSFE